MELFHVVFIIGLILNLTAPTSENYDNSFSTNCKIKDSCTGNTDNINFDNHSCMCDSDCFKYRDCCQGVLNRSQNALMYRNAHRQFKCVKIKTSEKEKSYYMISYCLKSWPEGEIKWRCRRLHPDAVFFTSVPVTEFENLKIYRNVYCALCNNLTIENISFWQLNMQCMTRSFNDSKDAMENLHYNSNLHQWEIRVEPDQSELVDLCKVQILPPVNLPPPRQCHYNVISTCPNTWKKISVRRLCSNHLSIRYFGPLIFRNKYCAMCNGIHVKNLSCHFRDNWLTGVRKTPIIRGLGVARLFSYTVFMQSLLNNQMKNNLCPEGQIRNPNGQCEEFSCSRNSVLLNGECIEV